jgi:cobyrinic acid a,c-diamide synthase
MNNPPGFVVAGTHSGVGKTTIFLALLRAFISRGLSVQPFKIGPDFIDAAYHAEIAGRPSINLDLWMMGAKNLRQTFRRFASTADLALIESMGALYDGQDGTKIGSAAEVARMIDLPVILVIDVWGMTRSTAALLNGFLAYDRGTNFVGFVMNRAGSARHAGMVLKALPRRLRNLCLGYVLHSNNLFIPERHLGLVTVAENKASSRKRISELDKAGVFLDIQRLVPLLRRTPTQSRPSVATTSQPVRIAVARDSAFTFYYEENLESLRQAGAELCEFRPTEDAKMPAGVAGVYIGGGYPESFSAILATNGKMKAALRSSSKLGMPIYAECGGFMYLGRRLKDFSGENRSMVGVFSLDTVMDSAYLAIRYVEVRTIMDSPLGPAGTVARGQEFHQSRVVRASGTALFHVRTQNGQEYEDGLLRDGTVGSYVHLHFASNPSIPANFVQRCRQWRDKFNRGA